MAPYNTPMSNLFDFKVLTDGNYYIKAVMMLHENAIFCIQ